MLKIKESLLKKLIREAIKRSETDNYDSINIQISEEFSVEDFIGEDGILNFLYYSNEIFDPSSKSLSQEDWRLFRNVTMHEISYQKAFREKNIKTFFEVNITAKYNRNSRTVELYIMQMQDHYNICNFYFKNGIDITFMFHEKMNELIEIFSNHVMRISSTNFSVARLDNEGEKRIRELIKNDFLDTEAFKQVVISHGSENIEILQKRYLASCLTNIKSGTCMFATGFKEVVDIEELHDFLKSLGFAYSDDDVRSVISNKYDHEVGFSMNFEYDWTDPPPPPSKDPTKTNLSIGTAHMSNCNINTFYIEYMIKTAKIVVEISKFYDIGD